MPFLTNRYRDDRALVRRMIKGDEMAFEEFSNTYIPVLYRFAHRRLGSQRDLAADLVQTTLCKVIPKLDTYRGNAAFVTWLCTCLRNEINGYFRKIQNTAPEIGIGEVAELSSDAALDPVLADHPERDLLRNEHATLVHDVLDSLPPHYGKALEWKYVERYPVREIAARLDLSEKAAESLLTRARMAFRSRYSQLASSAPTKPDAE
jgi:RNA polymerase sigma-70 factor (ECF subfamily)